MANQLEKFGLRPYRKLDGTPLVGAQNRYTIASGHTTAIFQGDMVIPLASGNIDRHTAGNATAIVGVFNGCFYNDPTTQKPTYSNYYQVVLHQLKATLLPLLLMTLMQYFL